MLSNRVASSDHKPPIFAFLGFYAQRLDCWWQRHAENGVELYDS